jgi:proteic killer suppression protein
MLVSRIVIRYSHEMIVSFRHKGLRALYEKDSIRGIQADQAAKLRRILTALDAANDPGDLEIPGFRLHSLSGKLNGHWSIWVNGNWRVIFRFIESDVELVDYQDYH